MALPQTIVYVLKSNIDSTRYYTGLTSNVAARFKAHNAVHSMADRSLMVVRPRAFPDRAGHCAERDLRDGPIALGIVALEPTLSGGCEC